MSGERRAFPPSIRGRTIIDILEQHLRHLREGEGILKPVYDHRDGSFGRPDMCSPKEFVIAEGLLGYTTRAMRDCYDVKIYLDPDEDLRVKWKVHRDTTKRGYRKRGGPCLTRKAQSGQSQLHASAADLRRHRHSRPCSFVVQRREHAYGRRPSRCPAYLAPDPAASRLRAFIRRLEQCRAACWSSPATATASP